MSVEREIELSGQMGSTQMWQAYGLYDLELTIPPTVYPPREDSCLLDQTIADFSLVGAVPMEVNHDVMVLEATGAPCSNSMCRG